MDDNPVVIADLAGTIRFWSAGAEKLFGHSAAGAIGQSLDLIVPPDYRQAHWNGFRRAMESGTAQAEGQIGAFPVRLANGLVTPVTGRLTLIRQMQGRVIAAMVVFAEAPPQSVP